MTVAALREHGVEVDDSEPDRWRVLPGPVARRRRRRSSRTSPTPRRSWRRPLVTGGTRDRRATGRPRRRRPATAARDPRPHGGGACRWTTRGLTVTGTGDGSAGSTSTCTTSASSPRPSPRCARWPTARRHLRGVAHIRGHETDRLAALATELTRLGCDVTETRRRPRDPARRRCTAASSATYADHRMAHAGGHPRPRRPRGRGRGRRDHRQDVPRLRRPSGRMPCGG